MLSDFHAEVDSVPEPLVRHHMFGVILPAPQIRHCRGVKLEECLVGALDAVGQDVLIPGRLLASGGARSAYPTSNWATAAKFPKAAATAAA